MTRSLLRARAAPRRLLVTAAVTLAACTPTLDWREVRVEGGALVALFPCKPDRRSRTVPLAGQPTRMQMLACAAGDDTFATSFLDVADPADVSAAIGALRQATVANVDGESPRFAPFALRGATPNPLAGKLHVAGKLPDGRRVQAHAAFFVHGLRVYQASVVGVTPDARAVEGFLAGLRLAS